MKNNRFLHLWAFFLAACAMLETFVFIHAAAVAGQNCLMWYVLSFPWFIFCFEAGRIVGTRSPQRSGWVFPVLRTEAGIIPLLAVGYFVIVVWGMRSFPIGMIPLLIFIGVGVVAATRGREVAGLASFECGGSPAQTKALLLYFYLGLLATAWLYVLWLLPALGLTIIILSAGAANAGCALFLFILRDRIPASLENRFYTFLYVHLALLVILGWGALLAGRGTWGLFY